jgi:hypothetical protein
LEDSLALTKLTFTNGNVADFGDFFGFVEAKCDSPGILGHVTEVRKKELLDQLVKFHIPE